MSVATAVNLEIKNSDYLVFDNDQKHDLYSDWLDTLYKNVFKILKDTDSIGRKRDLFNKYSELNEIYEECKLDNWDGYNSKAITPETYFAAKNLIDMLNVSYLNIPLPELSPEPDGDIGLEWDEEDGNYLIVSINKNNYINYASSIGLEKSKGFKYLKDTLPNNIINILKSLYADRN